MANANTEINLAAVHAAITDKIRAQFPDLATVEFYSDERDEIALPACLLEMSEMDGAPDIDPGTEQLAVNARFEARFIIGFRTPAAKMSVRTLAAAFGAWLRLQRFGMPIGPAEVIGAYPDSFSPKLDQHEVWRVEWQQVLHLGVSVWKDEGSTPATVFLGQFPLIGTGNEDEYTQVHPRPEA